MVSLPLEPSLVIYMKIGSPQAGAEPVHLPGKPLIPTASVLHRSHDVVQPLLLEPTLDALRCYDVLNLGKEMGPTLRLLEAPDPLSLSVLDPELINVYVVHDSRLQIDALRSRIPLEVVAEDV